MAATVAACEDEEAEAEATAAVAALETLLEPSTATAAGARGGTDGCRGGGRRSRHKALPAALLLQAEEEEEKDPVLPQ